MTDLREGARVTTRYFGGYEAVIVRQVHESYLVVVRFGGAAKNLADGEGTSILPKDQVEKITRLYKQGATMPEAYGPDDIAKLIADNRRLEAVAYAESQRLRDALVMIENRLECALMGDDVCRGCVDVARSYAIEALKPRQPEKK